MESVSASQLKSFEIASGEPFRVILADEAIRDMKEKHSRTNVSAIQHAEQLTSESSIFHLYESREAKIL